MKIDVIKGDITQVRADAIVNAANTSLLGGSGVDGAIHRAAGPELLAECRTLGGCRTGEAKLTKGYRLPAEFVIHTPGPVWSGGDKSEPELLFHCYENSLIAAEANGCKWVAFPSISTGIFGYPAELAAGVAMDAIFSFAKRARVVQHVTMVCFDDITKAAYDRALKRK